MVGSIAPPLNNYLHNYQPRDRSTQLDGLRVDGGHALPLEAPTLPCAAAVELYRTQCACSSDAVGARFDTSVACSNGQITTKYSMPCHPAAKAFLTDPTRCPCPATSSTTGVDVCADTVHRGTCIVGGGSGAAGAALALQHHGGTDNAIVIDSGFDSGWYDAEARKSGGRFPSFQITASAPTSWQSTAVEAPWRTVYGSGADSFPQWMALANTMGGQAMFNGGFWGRPGNMSTVGMSASVISAIAKVTESVAAPYDCTGRCGALMTAARNIRADVTVYAHPLAMNATGQRLSMENEILKTGIGIRTGKKVHSMHKTDAGAWRLVDDQEQPVATCDRVLLAAGVIGTPALIKRSADLASWHSSVGKNMVDHVGVIYVGTFAFPGDAANLNEAGGSNPIVTSNDGFGHTYVQCLDPDPVGTITCYFIPTGSNIPDSMRSEQSTVAADETHTFRFDSSWDTRYKTSTMETLKHAIAMTEAVYGPGNYFGLSAYGVPVVHYTMGGTATPVDFTGATGAPQFMGSIAVKNDHEQRVSSTAGLYAIYHAMGTTYDLVDSSNSHVIPGTTIALGDASVFAGTPGGMMSLTAMAHGYVGMTELLGSSEEA